MSAAQNFFLRNLWYYAAPAARLKHGHMLAKTILDEPIVLCRGHDGKVFALRDVCPHRGIPLSCGRMEGNEVECCYHGWRFDGQGACTHIPALIGHEGIKPENIHVREYPVVESQGGLWVYMEDPKNKAEERLPVPFIEGLPATARPFLCETMTFPCYIDHAVIGLMDPAHGPFVHTSWWWRSRTSIHEKAKTFGPSHLGFTMLRHKPSSNSFAYKILGGTPETEISFQLPGVRIEHIKVGKHIVGNLTCVTPVNETETEITHTIFTTIGWLRLLSPVLGIFARRFLNQDRGVVVKQQAGLKYEQNLLLIRDADTQARWYNQLKNEYARALADGRSFANPVKETVLRWRS